MSNQDERHNHWQQLAEQLGLEPERPAEPAPAIREVAAPKPPPHHPVKSEPPARAVVAFDEDTGFPRDRHRDTPAPVEAQEEAKETIADAEVETPPGDDELDKPRGPEGRGRRRRRRGSKAEDKNSPTEASDAPPRPTGADEPPEEGDAPRGRSRRRGRGRPRAESDKPPQRRADVVVEADDASATKVAPAVDDDDDLDDLSNWQAPSWQELIGSLYRPER